MDLHLLILTPDQKTRKVQLDSDAYTVGRAHANDISYPEDASLSRRQFKLMSETEMSQMGAVAFAEISKQTPPSRAALENAMVTCVATAITQALTGVNARTRWEVRVFADDTPNAFALPGGKIGVNTGLLQLARTQGQQGAAEKWPTGIKQHRCDHQHRD